MAKYECTLTGNINELLRIIDKEIMEGSSTASYEGGSDYNSNGTLCAVRVYERYSLAGSNRVSLNVTVIGSGEDLFISAITSGGSQAKFYKINTWGEEAFLEGIINIVEEYKRR